MCHAFRPGRGVAVPVGAQPLKRRSDEGVCDRGVTAFHSRFLRQEKHLKRTVLGFATHNLSIHDACLLMYQTTYWGIRSIGRSPALHAGGTGIETRILHFFSPFSLLFSPPFLLLPLLLLSLLLFSPPLSPSLLLPFFFSPPSSSPLPLPLSFPLCLNSSLVFLPPCLLSSLPPSSSAILPLLSLVSTCLPFFSRVVPLLFPPHTFSLFCTLLF